MLVQKKNVYVIWILDFYNKKQRMRNLEAS